MHSKFCLHWNFILSKTIYIENFLHWKISYIEKLFALKILLALKKNYWKIASPTKMLDLKLFWAVGVKLMYENFPFPLGKKLWMII
jgi:hypothetical protein